MPKPIELISIVASTNLIAGGRGCWFMLCGPCQLRRSLARGVCDDLLVLKPSPPLHRARFADILINGATTHGSGV